ncbi:Mitochondrial intermediate peptidase [Thelotrema lepadinum]|nr:Mitochondrial intermediate peptidase [Thelotrema lepadinum]
MARALSTSWICFRCLRRQQRVFQRRLTTAATATAIKPSLGVYQAAPKHEDETLKQIFNSQIFWQEFSEPKKSLWRTEQAGLLQNHFLRTPQGFQKFVEATLQRCQRLLDKVLAISTVEEYKKIVHYLDRLSDLLCRVIDLADFVRSTHPDSAYQQQAHHAHLRMYDYMNILNTTPGLYNQLNVALNNSEITSSWSEEELRVAQILRKDFSQSAIALPEVEREAFVRLSGKINDLGSRFLDGMRAQNSQIGLRSGRLQGLEPRFVQRHTKYGGIVKIPTIGSSVPYVLNSAQDESVRKEMYIASRTAAEEEINLLEELVKTRAKVAKLSGFDSYARMALSDKMAQTPEAVSKLLDALAADNRNHVKLELAKLVKLKLESSDDGVGSNTINAWDREYYRSRMLRESNRPTRTSESLSSFFSLGTVIQGISRLFSSLYGVRFQPVEPIPGETWSPDVRRLDVLDEDDTRIAVLYCDLFARDGKPPNPAHFTLRCSRLITAAEIEEHASQQQDSIDRTSVPLDPLALANDGMATTPLSDGSAYQLPTIALICDIPSPRSTKTPPLLPTSHLVTLFHEMGHAIHSILGRTKLQNVSGTRCATDFAELPSILMEYFATNSAVLGLWARHWQTDAPIPQDVAAQVQKNALVASTAKEAASDTEWQIILSLIDQAYHSPLAASSHGFDSDAIAHDIYSRYSSVPEPRETRWQGFFGHLVSYGGSYYSYLFDRAIAARVWEKVFNDGKGSAALDREKGERFKAEVLSWGGSREPWRCVAGLLKDSRLENGGEKAMEIVGGWGTER